MTISFTERIARATRRHRRMKRGFYAELRSGRITDTRGYGVEVRLPIRLFSSHFRIVPGVAYDHIETDLDTLELSALRFTIGFGFAALSEQ